MNRRSKWIVGAAAVAALAGGGGGIAMAGASGDDDEPPITGTELERASEAALDFTGEGKVTDTEAGDEDASYEVEVTLDDGKQTDVHLDEDFHVLNAETDIGEDDEGPEEDE
ncbi:PepSY domain-containing protein [Streptomyces sp. 6N223]|uniref:PepSY domain-containing protein n=1 Tax=Streptomyces sp. 6N223 TaxID=3457412 RepID=UPI003FD09C1E